MVGCQDDSACNYNVFATDASACTYATEICAECSGEMDGTGTVIDNDADDDGVCDWDEVVGCQDDAACNYNAFATDAGACIYATEICAECSGETDGTGVVIDNDMDDDGVCDLDEVVGCEDINACNYNAAATDADACTYATEVCSVCSGETDGTGVVIDNDMDDDGVVIGMRWSVARTLQPAISMPQPQMKRSCIFPDGICDSCSGETDGTGIVIDNDADDDWVCDEDEVVGCQDGSACNFNAAATDQGVCVFPDGICEVCSEPLMAQEP